MRDSTDTPDATSQGVGPAEVFGVRLLPPPRATRFGNRLRGGLARLYRAMAPPPARLLEAALGPLDLAVLAAMCHLELPDRLREPTTCERLAAELEVDAARLQRMLRYASTRGWVRIDRSGRIRRTRTTAFLERGHPGGWRAWIEFLAADDVRGALADLDRGLTSDGDAFAAANGAPFFDWMRNHPDRRASFDGAMAAGGRMHGLLLARTLDWSSSHRVCDIGGGNGALLGVLLEQHPHLEGVLLEVPEVVARAPRRPRLTAVGGDAFDTVPPGCDTYLLVNVIHDWDDDRAQQLLDRAAAAAAADTSHGTPPRVVVVEGEAHHRPRDDLATRSDVLMLALTPGGRERTAAEIAALADGAGLRLHRSHLLASGDVAHVLVPPSP